MTILTIIIGYFVVGFVCGSIFTIFNNFISRKIFNEEPTQITSKFLGVVLFIWPIFIVIITLVGGYKLVETSIHNYINYLSNILGDKK